MAIANDEALSMNVWGFFVFRIGTSVTNVGISQRYNLAAIRRISENFLIASHEVLKTTSPTEQPSAPIDTPFKHRPIFQH